MPDPGELVIEKSAPNSFMGTDLETRPRDGGVSDLVIVGAMSHICIDATTRAAADLDFGCIVVRDACATCDMEFDGAVVPAAKVHAAFMGALAQAYASVVSADDAVGNL